MSDAHDFPARLPAGSDDSAGALRWTCGVLALSTLALALLNAQAIVNWTGELPATPGTARVMVAADAWKARTADLRLDVAQEGLRRAWKRAEAVRWAPKRLDPSEGTPQSLGQVAGGQNDRDADS